MAAYNSYIRSGVEFGLLPVASMLNTGQYEDLEDVQRKATRTILNIRKRYGPDVPDYIDRLLRR